MNTVSPICATYDQASQAFMSPFVVPSEGVAIRSFMDAINNSQQANDLSAHPEDFDLYVIGHFNASTGLVTAIDPLGKPLLQGKQAKLASSQANAG